MKRQKAGVMPEITRDVYNGVKKFDRKRFNEFCKSLYGYGFEDGQNSVPGIDIKSILEVVGSVKGIGPKKLEEITAKVEALFSNKE